MSLDAPLPFTRTTSRSNRSNGRPSQMHRNASSACFFSYRDMIAPSFTALERRCYLLIPFRGMLPLTSGEFELDIEIHHVHIGSGRKTSYQELTRTDPLLRSLAETIIDGWPEDPKDVPQALRPYWNHRDTMTVEDGIILHGEAILVPPVEQEEVLQQIHEGHQGITKCQLRARNCVYWPGINKDIQRMVESRDTCQRF